MAFESRRSFGKGLEYKDPKTGKWVSQSEGDRLAALYDAEEKKKNGMNADGSPVSLKRDSLIDPATGLLKDQYQFKGQTIDPNSMEGYSAIKGEALRTGPSAWANLAKQKQQVEQSQALDQAGQNALSGNAQARSTLAMRGGLSAGARERLGSQMQKDIIGSRQQVAGQGILARAGIDVQDEQNRQGMLSNFANAEGQLTRYNTDIGNKGSEFNILQSLGEKGRGDDFAMQQYKSQMEKWAAGKQAEATAASGGGGEGGTWICSEIISRYGISKKDAVALNRLKEYGFEHDPEATHFYVYGCEPLVGMMKAAGFDWKNALTFMQTVVGKVQHDDMEDAMEFYRSYLLDLMDQYWVDCSDRHLVEPKDVKAQKSLPNELGA